jgi:hypothetical protein
VLRRTPSISAAHHERRRQSGRFVRAAPGYKRAPMDAQRIYRTFRPYALELAARHDTPIEDALRALARAASQCPADLLALRSRATFAPRARCPWCNRKSTGASFAAPASPHPQAGSGSHKLPASKAAGSAGALSRSPR